MRAVLAFPVGASPTYVPLGIASLQAYLHESVPACELALLDLNLEAWTALALETERGRALLGFVHGRHGDFYDAESYLRAREVWGELAAELERQRADARRYLETGEASAELERRLARECERVLRTDPELVGLSLVFPEQILHGLALARALGRLAPSLRIVLGGASLSALELEALVAAMPEVSAALPGEGEPAARPLFAGEAAENVPGLVHRRGGAIARNAPGPACALDPLPPPDFSGLPLAAAFNPQPVLPAVYSRGCRWRRCRFCAHNASFDRYRHKRAERFADELAGLCAATGARHVYLADQYLDAASLHAIAEALRVRRVELSFHAMARPSARHTRARLEAYRRAGCRWISWGVESASQRLLDLCDKGTRSEELLPLLAEASAAGISSLLMMIFGLPTSTDEDLDATLRFLEECLPHVDAITASRFVLFAGTAFAERAAELGLEGLAPRVLFTRDGRSVCSTRLDFHEAGSDGTPRPPRGALEVAAWERRLGWLGGLPLLNALPAEHYLLHASRPR
jgi:radical SAM superfamily enzyme YgiQ (UPF0313 family)